MLTQERVKELFEYRDGIFVNSCNRGKNHQAKAGMPAGSKTKRGHFDVSVDGKKYKLHRIIFLFHYGRFPDKLDHINGDPSNNALDNIRDSNDAQNNQNRPKQSNNTSGYRGVYLTGRGRWWSAEIKANGRKMRLGLFRDKTEAGKAYDKAANEHHKEFAFYNFPEDWK